uniref:Uncharacterized protein n=1 Tax=Physcomitrium patens TaxID=3218 RepID=A0A2K1KX52_PHYPA|nr:hypothetical protein PHYPA_005334 [Physcomitrium patens]
MCFQNKKQHAVEPSLPKNPADVITSRLSVVDITLLADCCLSISHDGNMDPASDPQTNKTVHRTQGPGLEGLHRLINASTTSYCDLLTRLILQLRLSETGKFSSIKSSQKISLQRTIVFDYSRKLCTSRTNFRCLLQEIKQ